MKSRFPSKSDVRVHAVVLGACLWAVYAINLTSPGLTDRSGQIKGSDFAQFYVAGWMSRHGYEAALNNPDVFAKVALDLLPDLNGVHYLPVYGPQVALFFSPLAALPYGWALALWLVGIAFTYGLCCWLVWRTCPHLQHEGATVFLVAVANPAFVNVIAHGQNSAIALALFTIAYLALLKDQRFLAGMAIGSLVFKPQLGLVAACVMVVNREWRVVAGAVVAATVQLGIACVTYGTAVMAGYWEWLRRVGEVTDLLWVKPYQMHSLSAFWSLLLPWRGVATTLTVISGLVTVLLACWIWKRPASLALRYSFLLLATVLVSPHLYVYDLVILVPALFLVADWARQEQGDPLANPVQRAVYFSYALPLLGVAAQVTHVQLSVIATTALTLMVGQIIIRGSESHIIARSAPSPQVG